MPAPSRRFSRFGTAPESPVDERDYSVRSFLTAPPRLDASVLPDTVGRTNIDYYGRYLSITDQGQEGSCTGHAMRNTKAISELRNRKYSWQRRFVPEFSPRGAYELGKKEGGYPDEEGAYMRDVASAAAKYGVPREKDWPYVPATSNSGYPQDIGTPSSRWLQYARTWRVGAYARANTLEEMLFALEQIGPLFISMNLTESFMDPGSDGGIPEPSGEEIGGHAMSFLAANQTDRRFLGANSWGTNWGALGFFWISFDHFLDKTPHEAWVVPDLT